MRQVAPAVHVLNGSCSTLAGHVKSQRAVLFDQEPCIAKSSSTQGVKRVFAEVGDNVCQRERLAVRQSPIDIALSVAGGRFIRVLHVVHAIASREQRKEAQLLSATPLAAFGPS